MEPDQLYLQAIIVPLVAHPEDVKIERTTDDRGVLLTLSLHQEDMGKIIGQQGETARAIRRLLRQLGMIHKSHTALKINEPEGSTRPQTNQNYENDL